MTDQKPPTLRFNRESGFMECYLLIRVDPGKYKRRLINKVDENPLADPSDPQTWASAASQIGRPSEWLNWPDTDLIPVHPPVVVAAPAVPQVVSKKPVPTAEVPKPKTKAELMRARLEAVARCTPPYLWEEHCRTPIPGPEVTDRKVRDDVARVRNYELKVLETLRAERGAGVFVLTPEAEEQERAWREQQESKLTTTLDAVKEAVNGSRIH